MERERRRSKPAGSNRALILVLVGITFAFAVFIGGGAWLVWKVIKIRDEATQAELEAEREADKAEAAAAFAKPVPPSAEEQAEFQQFFNRLGSALGRRATGEVTLLFDADRMTARLARVGAFAKLPLGQKRGFRTGVSQGIRTSIGQNLTDNELLRWDRTEVRRVRWSEDRGEAVVIAIHHEGEGTDATRLKMRWWLVAQAGGGWKIYDFEDLDMGMRISVAIGSMATPETIDQLAANPDRFKAAVADLRLAMAELFLRKDAEEAEKALARCRLVKLPDLLAALRELVEGALLLQREDAVGALKRLETSDRLLPGMPVVKLLKAACFNRLERYEEALAEARGYIEELGLDPLALGQAGLALEALGRDEEARDSFRKGLDEDADDEGCLHGFRRTLPVERKSELAERVARCKKPTEQFDSLLREARNDGDDAAVKALLAWLRKTTPGDPRVRTEDLRELVRAKKFPEAAAALRKYLIAAKPDDRAVLRNAYLFAMIEAGKPVEAYTAIPDGHAVDAFRTIAFELEDSLEDGEEEDLSPAASQLRALLDVHRRREPADPWLCYFEGVWHQSLGEFEKAERQLAEGMKKLERRPKNADSESDRAGNLESFRSRRVACLYTLKQGLKALAEVGPAAATFRQLANRYDGDQDVAGLEALLAAYQRDFPSEPAVKFWLAELLFLKRQYDAAAAGFQNYRTVAGDKDPESYRVVDRWIRSLIRANNAAKARSAVAQIGVDKVAEPLRAAVAAMENNMVELRTLLAAHAKEPSGLWSFYWDEDFGRIFAQEKFAELRKQFPDTRPKQPNQKAG
ncbi:MAG TPA: hypothetical protein VGL71_12280 [Urbifossiella sp.]